jgi:hypothetical protein
LAPTPGEAPPHFTPKRFIAIALPQTYAYKVGAPKSKLEIRVWGFSAHENAELRLHAADPNFPLRRKR